MPAKPYKPFNVSEIRSAFPILNRRINDHPLAYLDNAASAQKPNAVIETMARQMETSYANVHRGLHTLANETTEAYEDARQSLADYLGAASTKSIVFTRGATEALNLVAYGLSHKISEGDEIILSQMEHHSNIVPWHFMREQKGAVLKFVPVLDNGALDLEALRAMLTAKTKIVSVSHMSNVLGTINPIAQIAPWVKGAGAAFVVDGTQAAIHLPVNVEALGVDFYAITGHKLYGPTAIGALYGRPEALAELQPFNGGGEMIEDVFEDTITYAQPPYRFEAGTPPILEAIGLASAINWYRQYDPEDVRLHEMAVYAQALDGLRDVEGFHLFGDAPEKGSILSFNIAGIHAHDMAQILDKYGIAVRAGQHCTQPLMERLGIHSTVRASFGIYNTLDEADRLVEGVKRAIAFLS